MEPPLAAADAPVPWDPSLPVQDGSSLRDIINILAALTSTVSLDAASACATSPHAISLRAVSAKADARPASGSIGAETTSSGRSENSTSTAVGTAGCR